MILDEIAKEFGRGLRFIDFFFVCVCGGGGGVNYKTNDPVFFQSALFA